MHFTCSGPYNRFYKACLELITVGTMLNLMAPVLSNLLIKICVEEEPEGDLIDLATEPWKTQRKTTSWHLQKSEENWVLTQADTGGKTKIQISRKF